MVMFIDVHWIEFKLHVMIFYLPSCQKLCLAAVVISINSLLAQLEQSHSCQMHMQVPNLSSLAELGCHILLLVLYAAEMLADLS